VQCLRWGIHYCRCSRLSVRASRRARVSPMWRGRARRGRKTARAKLRVASCSMDPDSRCCARCRSRAAAQKVPPWTRARGAMRHAHARCASCPCAMCVMPMRVRHARQIYRPTCHQLAARLSNTHNVRLATRTHERNCGGRGTLDDDGHSDAHAEAPKLGELAGCICGELAAN